ncbi:pilus assembly protein FimV [Shewanella algae]|uniref:Pilus assembly protein FimV n=1 Tax=Shewanella algae TaxID=38313 RepID=A0AAD1K993_9GAMM|nr:FimV/HubP family polar landmark protein [Shewanella algae]MBO2594933.1 pilus assembly protein FimV [Shewanella algae]MBO2666287.1 pilus assembly protein FimV [Shewanella algae]MBO2678971.1 pilus assembly protein FimV [Shewanella algae]BCV44743.1 pilus assembly protein FimV [Shewanella algae]
MNFRTSYLVGLMAAFFALNQGTLIEPAHAEGLKITGPDGQVRQQVRQYGPTTPSDTFWSIAQKVRPDSSVSIYQVMAAIFEANPHAFTSNNYNSLERGMILLIPSKEVMQAIPQSMARARAEQDDKSWSSGKPLKADDGKIETAKAPERESQAAKEPTPATQTPTAAQPSKVATSAKENSAQPKVSEPSTEPTQVAADKSPATTTEKAATEATPETADDNSIEALQSRNLSLTDELGRAQDLLTVANTDNQGLQAQIDELNQRLSVLEESLQASKKQEQQLKAENAELKQQLQAASATANEPDDLWRSLMDNPLLLALAAAIPAVLLLLLLWSMLRRRRKQSDAQAPQTEAAPMAAASAATAEMANADDELAVHLDDDPDDSIDSLLDVDSSALQPEPEVESDNEQMDMAQEMFIDSGEGDDAQEAEDEGQSLDDLWAEAMGEQESGEQEEPAEEDLDSLLAGLDDTDKQETIPEELQAESVPASEPELSETLPEDVTAAFDQSFEAELEQNLNIEPEEQSSEPELDTELQSLDLENQADDSAVVIDEDEDLSAAIAAELAEDEQAEETLDETQEADLDALLAGFDVNENTEPQIEAGTQVEDDSKTEAEEDLSAAIAAELDEDDSADTELGEEADIDALLAGFDSPAEESTETEDLSDAIAAELEDDNVAIDSSDTEADIDALLAGFDDLGDAVETQEAEAEPVQAEEESEDLDALLAGLADDVIAIDNVDEAIAETDEEDSSEVESDDATERSDAELDAMLAGLSQAEDLDEPKKSDETDTLADESRGTDSAPQSAQRSDKDSGFFDDLKAGSKSHDPHILEWEPSAPKEPSAIEELLAQEELSNQEQAVDVEDSVTDTEQALDIDLAQDTDDSDKSLSDDDLLAAFSENVAKEAEADEEFSLELGDDDSLDLEDHKLTVDEALAALDAKEKGKVASSMVPEHDLSAFQKENGFIDIERLLSEADEGNSDTDPYKELDVDMGELDSLVGAAAMVDVDDEENSVNAKLDLARAYIEIDDKDSAKALLKEVELDGNARQQEEAAALIKTLG